MTFPPLTSATVTAQLAAERDLARRYPDPALIDQPISAHPDPVRPTWGAKVRAIAGGVLTAAVLGLFVFVLPAIFAGV